MNFTLIIPLFLGIIRYKVLLCVLLIFRSEERRVGKECA